MSAKVHDADLCKEIKRLEKRVEQLERERYCRGHYVWPYYPRPYIPSPVWYGNLTGNTTYTIDSNTTTGTDITIG